MKNLFKQSGLAIILVILAIVWFVIYGVGKNLTPSKLNVNNLPKTYSAEATASLAQCLTDKGFKFYGAFWCSHCNNQKKLFGTAVDKLPYIECSTTDGKTQLEVCKQAGITVYPTWVSPDGTKTPGEIALEKLAAMSSCPLN